MKSKKIIYAISALFLSGLAGAANIRPAQALELGVHDQPGCNATSSIGLQNVANFTNWLGRAPDRVMDFTWLDSWKNLVRSAAVVSSCWHQAGYTKLTLGLAMIPADGVSTLAHGAAGAYDAYFLRVAQSLVANGFPNAVLRVGWEFNIPNFPWAAYKDPRHFVQFYQRIVNVMRSVPGAQFKFDWNIAMNGYPTAPGNVMPETVYPGDQYVDYIGADLYNQWWNSTTKVDPQARFNAFVVEPYGLQWQANFAAQHQKQISFPEWATGTRPDGHGGGDDPVFIQSMAAWMTTNNAAYGDYFDENCAPYNGQISQGAFPQAASAFITAFGNIAVGSPSGPGAHRTATAGQSPAAQNPPAPGPATQRPANQGPAAAAQNTASPSQLGATR